MKTIASQLITTGLIQFGLFGESTPQAPIKFQLDMLASYPELLDKLAEHISRQIINLKIDHLVCTPDAIPLGVAVALELKISLVYAYGVGDAVKFVGAYDIGHPALLLTNVIDSKTGELPLIRYARQVGLEIGGVFGVINCGVTQPGNLEIGELLRLTEWIAFLLEEGQLSSGQAQAILNWDF